MCDIWGIKKVNILPYRPQSNGITERLNRTVKDILKTLTHRSDETWDDSIPTVQSAVNGTYHSSLGDTPHFLLYGWDKRLPYELLEQQRPPNYSGNYAEALAARNREIFVQAKKSLESSRDKILEFQHRIAQAKDIGCGAYVFIRILYQGEFRPMLEPTFKGPYRVLSTKNNKATCLNLKDHSQEVVHFDRIKLAHEVFVPDTIGQDEAGTNWMLPSAFTPRNSGQ